MRENLHVVTVLQDAFHQHKNATNIRIVLMAVTRLPPCAASIYFTRFALPRKWGGSTIHLFSDCCSHVLVQYEVDDSVYQVNPFIFTVFEREEGSTNRRDHYKSLDGKWSLDYANCGSWAIKNSTQRQVK